LNIYVLMKQVPDTETKIRIKSDGSGIEQSDIKWVINPYDEFAIEEALKIREQQKAGTVTVVTMGPDRCVEALRTALAMGADNAIHVKDDSGAVDSCTVGKALTAVVKKEPVDLLLTGKQAIDDDQAAVFGYASEFLNWPSVSVVVKVEIAADAKTLKAEREVEGGSRHLLELPIPCVVAVNKGINTPRYASLPGIMKAKKKEIKVFTLADLGLGSEPTRTEEKEYQLPPERAAGKKLSGEAKAQVQELVRLLHEEAKLI